LDDNWPHDTPKGTFASGGAETSGGYWRYGLPEIGPPI
jgi:hypothetical protein